MMHRYGTGSRRVWSLFPVTESSDGLRVLRIFASGAA
jgi:hypothetical protein